MNKDQLVDSVKNFSKEEQLARASAILSEIEEIDTNEALNIVRARIRNKNKVIKLYQLAIRIAASLFIPLLAYAIWNFFSGPNFSQISEYSMQEITTPLGIRSKVTLPDGSFVWLNSNSKISYSIPFIRDKRFVQLEGEAFFDAVSNTEVPLLVQSGKTVIKVTGTKFNLKNYPKDQNIEVSLVEGEVSLYPVNMNEDERYVLQPNNHAIVGKVNGVASISNMDLDKYTAWHEGRLVFDDSPMEEVARRLERWFGIDVIILDEEILTYRFTTTFEDQSIHQVLELLSLASPIRIKYSPVANNANGGKSERSKVYISQKTIN